MKSELGQSVDHFRRAANLAAQETSATVGPKWNAARDRMQPTMSQAKGAASSGWESTVATLAPLVTAATENVRHTGKETKKSAKAARKRARKNAEKLERRANKLTGRKQTGRRTGRLFGLALAGAVVGAGAAFALRRRRAAQWDEYDPSAPITSTPPSDGADDAAFEPAEPATRTAPATEAPVTGTTDQTDSAQHSPTVARMVGGQNKE